MNKSPTIFQVVNQIESELTKGFKIEYSIIDTVAEIVFRTFTRQHGYTHHHFFYLICVLLVEIGPLVDVEPFIVEHDITGAFLQDFSLCLVIYNHLFPLPKVFQR